MPNLTANQADTMILARSPLTPHHQLHDLLTVPAQGAERPHRSPTLTRPTFTGPKPTKNSFKSQAQAAQNKPYPFPAMHFSTLLLPLLAVTPAISAARLSVPHGAAKRHSQHPSLDSDKIRRAGTSAMEAREGLDQASSSMKGKRLVRKKRSASSACQPGSSNSTVTSSSPSSVSIFRFVHERPC